MAKEFSKDVYNSHRWRKCSKAYAESKLYICEHCGRPIKTGVASSELRYIVHHKQELTPKNIVDDSIVYGWDNLQLLCIECHNKIHAPKQQGTRQYEFDGNGQIVKVIEAPHTEF